MLPDPRWWSVPIARIVRKEMYHLFVLIDGEWSFAKTCNNPGDACYWLVEYRRSFQDAEYLTW